MVSPVLLLEEHSLRRLRLDRDGLVAQHGRARSATKAAQLTEPVSSLQQADAGEQARVAG